MNRILITGGAGYIGSVLVKKLLDKGYAVTVLDRFMFGGETLLPYIHNKNLSILPGDVRDTELVKKTLDNIHAVIHLAALVGEPACKENPVVTKQINLEATKNFASLAREAGIERFIFSSTCSNYGVSDPNEEATEDSELHPLSLYAETKIESERFLLSQNTENFHTTILRLATIFGLSPRMRFNLLIGEMAREAATDGIIEIRNENAWRPFLHTEDVADAILVILNADKKKVAGEIYNVVSENVQKKQLAELAKKANPKMKVVVSETEKDDLRDYRVSADRFKKTFSWSPKFTVAEGFNEIFDAVRKGVFLDPYEFRYNGWFDEEVFKYE